MGYKPQTITLSYQEREISVGYREYEGEFEIEEVQYQGRDITGLVDHSKINEEMPEAMYQKTVLDEERNIDL